MPQRIPVVVQMRDGHVVVSSEHLEARGRTLPLALAQFASVWSDYFDYCAEPFVVAGVAPPPRSTLVRTATPEAA